MTKHQPFVKPKVNKPIDIIRRNIELGKPTLVAGPMVRYSKLPFRATVRRFGADIVYSPMILAREFVRNETARVADFSTNDEDTCLIVQVGVNNTTDMLRMIEMINPYCDGVGINCGCPIKDQVREGIGAAMMSKPQVVHDLVKASKEKFPDFCIEVKIRIHDDIEETVDFIKIVEKSGVDFITIHGRTKDTRSSIPANFEAIKYLKSIATVPVIANGDCFKPEDVDKIVKYTGVDGVMAVRGVLANPALFAGYDVTPWKAVEWFWYYAVNYGLHFRLLQHHLSEMLDKSVSNKVLREMNFKKNLVDVIEWFDEMFDLKRFGEEGFGERVEIPIKEGSGLVFSNGIILWEDAERHK